MSKTKIPKHIIDWASKIQVVLFTKMADDFPYYANVEVDGWAIHLDRAYGDCTASFEKLSDWPRYQRRLAEESDG